MLHPYVTAEPEATAEFSMLYGRWNAKERVQLVGCSTQRYIQIQSADNMPTATELWMKSVQNNVCLLTAYAL